MEEVFGSLLKCHGPYYGEWHCKTCSSSLDPLTFQLFSLSHLTNLWEIACLHSYKVPILSGFLPNDLAPSRFLLYIQTPSHPLHHIYDSHINNKGKTERKHVYLSIYLYIRMCFLHYQLLHAQLWLMLNMRKQVQRLRGLIQRQLVCLDSSCFGYFKTKEFQGKQMQAGRQ
jgi:hypothetical protein